MECSLSLVDSPQLRGTLPIEIFYLGSHELKCSTMKSSQRASVARCAICLPASRHWTSRALAMLQSRWPWLRPACRSPAARRRHHRLRTLAFVR